MKSDDLWNFTIIRATDSSTDTIYFAICLIFYALNSYKKAGRSALPSLYFTAL